MITVGSREAKEGFRELLASAQTDNVVVLRHGKPIAVITGVAGMELEDLYWTTDDDLQNQIKGAREALAAGESISHEEVKRRLGIR